jgi:hypothetical protein
MYVFVFPELPIRFLSIMADPSPSELCSLLHISNRYARNIKALVSLVVQHCRGHTNIV